MNSRCRCRRSLPDSSGRRSRSPRCTRPTRARPTASRRARSSAADSAPRPRRAAGRHTRVRARNPDADPSLAIVPCILGDVGFGIDLRAHPRKAKGLFRRGPDPRELAERFGRLMPRTFKGWDRRSSQIAAHPAAPPVRAMLEGTELHVAGELRDGRTRLGERSYVVDGAAGLTMLGPRDAAWRDQVLADPMHAADAFAWWNKGDGVKSRELLAMWHEVPWREPLGDRERAVLEQFRLDAEAAGLALPDEPVGYRRHDLRFVLSGCFSVRLAGAFVVKL